MSFIAFMMSAGRIINAVTEFLSGFIIDRTHTKIGKARPWILGTSFFVALPVFMVFNCPLSLGQTGRMVWVFVCYLMHIAVFGQISQLVVGAYGVPILMYIAQSSVTLFAERCGYAVVPLVCSILLVLISNFMNADEEVIKLRNTQ